jgi:hypothetical protein
MFLEKLLAIGVASEYRILPPGTGCAVPPVASGYGADAERSTDCGRFFEHTRLLVPNVPCLVATDADLNDVVEGAMQFQPRGYEG